MLTLLRVHDEKKLTKKIIVLLLLLKI